MIDRYSRPDMTAIWTDEAKCRHWLAIELAACDAMAELGDFPVEKARSIRERADFRLDRMQEIERETKHDVIAFLTAVGDYIGDDTRFLHKGMTSSDVLDTGLAMQTVQAGKLLQEDLSNVKAALKERAYEHKMTPCIGRSHGIHAEPVTFGLKLAIFYDEFTRHEERLKLALDQMAVCKISGAVGTFANVDPRVESMVAEKLGLSPAPASNQVIQRDRHAFFVSVLAGIGATMEKVAVEIRHLQRSEVREVGEGFSKGQKGSSAMPHKRNPIATENLTGVARLLRGYAVSQLESVALWHERDISHSSVERVVFPDATIVLDYGLHRLANVMRNLDVFPEQMQQNLDEAKNLFNSQRVLLRLTEKGLSREAAYALVQRNAMEAWREQRDLREVIGQDAEVTAKLSAAELDGCFDMEYHLKHVDTIFGRVFGG